jgi:hypothetical protein
MLSNINVENEKSKKLKKKEKTFHSSPVQEYISEVITRVLRHI